MRKAIALTVLGAIGLVLVGGIVVVRAEHDREEPSIATHRTFRDVLPIVHARGVPNRSVQPGRAVPLHAPVAPRRARAVALTYALDAFNTVVGAPTNAWVPQVAGICAPAWLSHIDHADSAQGSATRTVRPQIESTFASWAPVGAVGVTVVVRVGGANESLYVELRKIRGRYLVEAAQ